MRAIEEQKKQKEKRILEIKDEADAHMNMLNSQIKVWEDMRERGK